MAWIVIAQISMRSALWHWLKGFLWTLFQRRRTIASLSEHHIQVLRVVLVAVVPSLSRLCARRQCSLFAWSWLIGEVKWNKEHWDGQCFYASFNCTFAAQFSCWVVYGYWAVVVEKQQPKYLPLFASIFSSPSSRFRLAMPLSISSGP